MTKTNNKLKVDTELSTSVSISGSAGISLSQDSSGNLQVNVLDTSDNPISPATEGTLQDIKTQTDKLSFDASNNLNAIINNLPSDYPDSTTHTKLDTINTSISSEQPRKIKLYDGTSYVDAASDSDGRMSIYLSKRRQETYSASGTLSAGTSNTYLEIDTSDCNQVSIMISSDQALDVKAQVYLGSSWYNLAGFEIDSSNFVSGTSTVNSIHVTVRGSKMRVYLNNPGTSDASINVFLIKEY